MTNFTLKLAVPPTVIKELLNYIYSDSLQSRDVTMIVGLERLAAKLQMVNLQNWCKFLLEFNHEIDFWSSPIFSTPITSTLPSDIHLLITYIINKYFNNFFI